MIDWNLLQKLEKEVAKDNVTVNAVGPYRLFKYTNGCHIDGNWNEWNREARGIIIREDTGEIVCRPMPKFFNLGERPETCIDKLPDEAYIVYEKLDGSCGNAYLDINGNIAVATPGSMESEQAIWASDWLRIHLAKQFGVNGLGHLKFKEELKKCTPVFEILWPDNPGNNVVNYGDREELVLLTIRLFNGQEIMPHMVDAFAEQYGFSRPKEYNHVLSNDMDDTIRENEEGYVIYYPMSGMRVKVKSALYKMLHKMLDNISPKGIIELIQGREYRNLQDTLRKHCPDMARQADDIAAELRRKFQDLKYLAEDMFEQASVIEHRDHRTMRKKQAAHIQANAPQNIWGLVFAMLDGKYHDEQTWEVVKRGLKERK